MDNSITINSTDMTPAVTRRHEFDLGLMLNMPGGASIPPGSTISTPFGNFTLSTTAGPGVITYALADTPAQVAAKVLAGLQAVQVLSVTCMPRAPTLWSCQRRVS